MVNIMQRAIIKKDMRAIAFNKRLFPVLLVIPLICAVLLPTIFILGFHFAPDSMDEFQQLLALAPASETTGGIQDVMIDLLMNSIMPVFFMLIPVMVASVMAASAFIGEKEKRTLETLLYSPLSLRQLFQAKVLASFVMSMLVSISSFLLMLIVVEVEVKLTTGVFYLPGLSWLITMLLLSPTISMIAISLIVRGSAKAQTVEESQQRAVFLILPFILLVVGQFTGLVLISDWLLLAIGAVCALVAALLLRRALSGLSYEALLK